MSGYENGWDGELLRRMSFEDRASALLALDEVFRRHGEAVLSFCASSLRHPPLAEQVVHDVFAELFAGRKDLEMAGHSVRSHLIILAHRRCAQMAAAPPADLEADAGGSWRGSSQLLSSEQRLAIDLAILGEMNCAQVAALLERSEADVKALIREGLSRVATTMIEGQRSHGAAEGPAVAP